MSLTSSEPQALVETGKIRVLPADVIGRIAAGEVIERPASVLKELIDNSLDAGSRRIHVEVAESGSRLIRVADDGEGMGRRDVALAFERHATSKLRRDEDLAALTSLGFRGEALPSIGAVAKVKVLTAQRDQPMGTELRVVGGVVTACIDAAAAAGTQIEVAELFFNTPARRKFLKAPSTEWAHLCQAVQHAALAWPEVSFELAHNGQQVLSYQGGVSRRDRVQQVYGAKFADQTVVIAEQRPGIHLEGYALKPTALRSGRTPQDILVNRRAVKQSTVLHAMYDGYGSFLPKGSAPRFVLFLDVDPSRVDVNVHPAKREIRLADQDLLHQLIRHAVRQAVGREADGLPIPTMTSVGLAAQGLSAPPPPKIWSLSAGTGDAVAEPAQPPMASSERGPGREEETRSDLTPTEWAVRPLGQLEQTFLVAQVGPELHVVDQHTAHERVLFERLMRSWQQRRPVVQPLLIPEPLELPAHRAELLRRHVEELDSMGLQLEPFGAAGFLVRGVPAELGKLDYSAFVEDLLDDLTEWRSTTSLESRVRPVLASLACHGAVRAGRGMELPEIHRLISDWVTEGMPTTCPHGRRIALRLSTEELGRIFGRI
jgi:DNA mismatch repair protein MutL